MSGVNSDRDETTRTPGLTSEPSLCVPVRPTPQLGDRCRGCCRPTPARKDFLLSPANEFGGLPDPTDAMGNIQDVAIGLSRTFLDLVGFHVYNSGTLCLDIGGNAMPQLNAGTLSVIVGSLGNIIEDRKAPLTLVLRPQTPLTFTIGAGDMTDPLLHIAISDLRIDFYAWIEERYVRLLTMGVDLNVGLNLTVTKDANGKPAIQPMLVGVDAKNVTIRVSNTDLLQETPAGARAGVPVADQHRHRRARRRRQADRAAVGGRLQPRRPQDPARADVAGRLRRHLRHHHHRHAGAAHRLVEPRDRPDASRRCASTRAIVESSTVPTRARAAGALRAERIAGIVAARPAVTLALGTPTTTPAAPVEYAWRIDGGMWRPWTRDAHPTLARRRVPAAGAPHHRRALARRRRLVDRVGSRSRSTCSSTRCRPSCTRRATRQSSDAFRFGGFDIVTDSEQAAVRLGPRRRPARPPGPRVDSMSSPRRCALTDDGARPLVLYAKDEAGNIGSAAFDLGDRSASTAAPPRRRPAGCGCDVGGGDDDDAGTRGGVVALFLLWPLVLLRRRGQGARRR